MAKAPEVTRAGPALSLELDGDGVAWLSIDSPGTSVNILSTSTMVELDELLGEVEEAVRNGRAKALVIRSGKPGTFIAGADIREIEAITDAREAESKSAEGQRIFRRLESLPIPSIAVIDGICLGGGTELALASSYRLATDRPETRIGLPEVKLGIIPGFGGTTRLPRLIGPKAAIELIASGKTISASRARRLGLVDELIPGTAFDERVRHFTWERIDRGRLRQPRRRRLLDRFLDETAPGRALLFRSARREVLKETGGHYPAPLAALNTIARSLSLPLEAAFEREAHTTGRLIASEISKNLIHVFNLIEGAKRAAPGATALEVERTAVVGAGVMGGGIAQLMAYRDLPVRLKDIEADALSSGLSHAQSVFERAVERRRMDRRVADQKMALISPTLDYSGFGTADLVVEAIVERSDVKQMVLREAESYLRPEAILVSNTSTISISELQGALERPDRFCGMHFFNPVDRMPLVEVIRGAETGTDTLAAVFELALRLGKTPVVVNDGPGFLVNRLLAPYLNEAGWLLGEGASIEAVDSALREFGMPMGPFRLLDEIGLDISRHASTILYQAFGERMEPALPLLRLADTDRLGRKGGRGFYRYEGGREKGVDETVYSALGLDEGGESRRISAAEIRDRSILVMVNEAARALEDGIVSGAGEIDLAMVTGTGFPPFRGGLLRYADSLGTPRVLDRLLALEQEHGSRFEPAPLLGELARSGRGFYS